ncbi:hypothetical protein [Phytohabitans rumicis]
MARGGPIDSSGWPADRTVRSWFVYCDRLHRANGMPSQRTVAGLMGLSAPTRVGELLRGLLPADADQARRLLEALGAVGDEVDLGLRKHAAARRARDAAEAAVVRQHPGWWIRSGYVAQVRTIAPVELHDRDAELAELAGFCDGAERYVWWRADARAGKTALMAWFVTHPPPDVWVVSFFVTGRMVGYADATAYTDVLLEQLAAITGQTLPNLVTVAQRDALRHRLLEAALVEAARQRARLVLVVDGLDEDHSTRPRSGLASIASLLPRHDERLRVIVAGRPDPRLPRDVDPDHPLHTCARRPLPPSPHARSLTEAAQTELDHVLTSDPDGLARDVVGLVTASGGGLAQPDLEHLTGRAPYELDALLSSVFGRTVGSRAGPGGAGPPVLLFTHETLYVQAVARLGVRLIDDWRQRLHDWAATYAARDWPADTPRYLIRGYPQLLAETRDSPRLVALATDPTRHDRMLSLTGGDAAALGEITTAQDLVLAQPEPDLLAMARLSIRRDRVASRNAEIPTVLPAVWAAIGQPDRAEAVAHGITDQFRRARALAAVAMAAAGSGDLDRAQRTALAAETVAGNVTDPHDRARAFVAVAKALAAAGEFDRAEAACDLIDDRYQQTRAQAAVAAAIAAAGEFDRAEALTRAALDPYQHGQVLAAAAGAIAAAGDLDRAEKVGRDTTDPYPRLQALAAVAEAAIAAGDRDRAGMLADKVEALARGTVDPYARARALAAAARAIASAGEFDRAEVTARSTTDLYPQVQALAAVADVAARAGDRRRAGQLADAVEALADRADHGYERARALAAAAGAIAAAGDLDRAEAVAHRIYNPDNQTQALAAVATAAAAAGHHDRARRLADEAETVAHRSIADRRQSARRMTELADMAGPGRSELTRLTARMLADPYQDAQILAAAATATGAAGDLDRTRRLADEAESATRGVADPYRQAHLFAVVAEARAASDDLERAEATARGIVNRDLRTGALAALRADDNGVRRQLLDDTTEAIARSVAAPSTSAQAHALAAAARMAAAIGDLDRTGWFVDEAREAARGITDHDQRTQVRAALVEASVAAGDLDRADAIARIHDFVRGADVQIAMVAAVAAAGDLDRAEAAARDIRPGRSVKALAAVVNAAAAAGDVDRAEAIARSVTSPREQAQLLAAAARSTAAAGDLDRARPLADAAEAVARGITWQFAQMWMQAEVAEALSVVGDLARAEAIACGITGPEVRMQALAALAVVDADHSRHLAEAAAATALDITGSMLDVHALTRAFEKIAIAAGIDRADVLARRISDPNRRETALIGVVEAAVAARELSRAEALARSLTNSYHWPPVLTVVVEATAAVGEFDRAEAIAVNGRNQDDQTRMLAAAAKAIAAVGDRDRTRVLVDAVENAARNVTNPHRRTGMLTLIAEAAATVGDLDRAEAIVNGIDDPEQQAQALAAVAAVAGDPHSTRRLITDAEAAAGRVTELYGKARALVAVVEAATAAGELDRAEAIARGITEPDERARVLTGVVEAAAAGELDRAEAVARGITEPEEQAQALAMLAETASPARAGHLFGHALAVGSWSALLPAMARRYPQVVVKIIDELYEHPE